MSTSRKLPITTDTTAKPSTMTVASTQQPSANRFPIAQYASVLGVYLSLVVFTALYLPRTTRSFTPLADRETDRYQSELMEALTADPFSTLCSVSVGLTLLQVWWAGWVRKWSFQQTTKGTAAETKLERVKFDGLRFARFKDAAVFTSCATLATYVVVVMFGAPLTTHFSQTALFAFVIAILTGFTPAFVLGSPSLSSDTSSMINRLTWTRLFVELSPRSEIEYVIVCPTWGTLIGAWLGAIPIALDWDRPWQAWPLTLLFGSLGGHNIGALVAFAFITTRWFTAELFHSNQ